MEKKRFLTDAAKMAVCQEVCQDIHQATNDNESWEKVKSNWEQQLLELKTSIMSDLKDIIDKCHIRDCSIEDRELILTVVKSVIRTGAFRDNEFNGIYIKYPFIRKFDLLLMTETPPEIKAFKQNIFGDERIVVIDLHEFLI